MRVYIFFVIAGNLNTVAVK